MLVRMFVSRLPCLLEDNLKAPMCPCSIRSISFCSFESASIPLVLFAYLESLLRNITNPNFLGLGLMLNYAEVIPNPTSSGTETVFDFNLFSSLFTRMKFFLTIALFCY